MAAQRILVTGFPHCGTTILRAKIGDCKDVYDSIGEFAQPPGYSPNIPNKWYVWKTPFLHTEFRNNTFAIKKDIWLEHDIIIPIIRNPWYVFTSLYKRGKYSGEFDIRDNKQGHSLSYYFNAAHIISDAFQNKYDKVYPIKYEDIFENNYQKLRELFDTIGLEYDDDIFHSRTKVYKHHNIPYIEDFKQESNEYKPELRVWQINQPLQNMNKEVDIPDEISEQLSANKFVKELGYSDPRLSH
jgi:hypothetical protein